LHFLANSIRRTGSLCLLCLILLAACQENKPLKAPAAKGCIACHAVKLDKNHDLACTSCHQGNGNAAEKNTAHLGLIGQPAHPEAMAASCGKCHPAEVKNIQQTSHFTLKNLVNRVRHAFGATADLQSLTEIPITAEPKDSIGLADDLLRRRCLRCHLYFKGDDYPSVTHGTGCAACHLAFRDGKLSSHQFLASPGDRQCLSCHYGNTVGFDYYGRFEHDLNQEYRTPYTTREEHFRPYGVEYHELAADIHKQRGLSCTDCHSGRELMQPGRPGPSCADCHDGKALAQRLPDRIQKKGSGYLFLAGPEKKEHPLPLMTDPAHKLAEGKIACQVCHAQWSFNDQGKYFLRSDTDDFSEWDRLTTQGSSEVTKILSNNTDSLKEELPPTMTDKIQFKKQGGLWYKGYGMRRWETLVVARDENGVLSVVRPLLDYSISWRDKDGRVRFDSRHTRADNDGFSPYTPHTTGKAGIFFLYRLNNLNLNEPTREDRKKN
jgi:hypothetical protein